MGIGGSEWPQWADGVLIYACCVSEIDRPCQHERNAARELPFQLSADMATEVVKAFGPERFAEREDRDWVGWYELTAYGPDDVYRREDRLGNPLYSFVDLGDIARDDSMSVGQATTVGRSNFHALMRDYPDRFTYISYAGADVLGIFLVDLDDQLAEVLLGLKHEHPVYDEDAMSTLEQEDIDASWESWGRQHVLWEVNERTRDDWDAIGDAKVDDLLWGLVSFQANHGAGDRPVHHTGIEVVWEWDDIIGHLSSAIQRTAHKMRKRGLIPA